MTPDDYERQAAEAEAQAEKLRALAELQDEQARWLRQQAAKLRRIEGGLSTGNRRGNLSGNVLHAQRLVRSKSLSKTRGDTSTLVRACQDAGMTLHQLAAEMGVTHSFLSQCGHGKKAAPDTLKARIKRRIGFDAWPPPKKA